MMLLRQSSSVSMAVVVRMFLALCLVLLLSVTTTTTHAARVSSKTKKSSSDPNAQKSVALINESGATVDVYWVNPQNGSLHKMNSENEVPHGATIQLNSFAGHEFDIYETANPETGCGGAQQEEDGTCRHVLFEVSANDDQRVFLTRSFEAILEDATTKAKATAGDLVQHCQNQVKRKVDNNDNVEESLKILLRCVEESVTTNLVEAQEEVAFQASVRKDVAAKLENYTCEDSMAETSEPVATEVWTGARDEKPRNVLIMHDRPASQIHVVQDFIDQVECDSMEAAAVPLLHRATVADGAGGSKFSEHRKAMQAGIKVPWELEDAGNPIARLSRRVYDYSNHVLGLNLEEHGQEDLMSIQYFGRGKNDTAPDRYTPHCDGDCTGLKHKHGTRMATMVMYCKIPSDGGHTNFRNSGVHVKPQMGNAIFFSYIDPESKIMDTGFTEHSGCPVFEGEKKIVTQWIRYGVDSENPWDSFNTLGIKKSEEKDY